MPKKPTPIAEGEVLVVEDPVLDLVIAAVAAADQRAGGDVGLDRFVVADPVLGRVDLRGLPRGELIDHAAERPGRGEVGDDEQDEGQRQEPRHRPRAVGDEDRDQTAGAITLVFFCVASAPPIRIVTAIE